MGGAIATRTLATLAIGSLTKACATFVPRIAPSVRRISHSPRSKRSFSVAMSSEKSSLTVYTAGTPNGWKPTILLEELGMQYGVREISLGDNEQKQDWYTKINPNGRIPSLVDHGNGDLAIFESGAIMMYLCDRFDQDGKFLPKDLEKRYEVIAWLMFQMGGIGPMQGQANHFLRFAPEKVEYGINRYINETKRLYGVIDKHLADKEWLAAGQYTIADMANFSWIVMGFFAGIDVSEFPNLEKWYQKIKDREAVVKGLNAPAEFSFMEQLNDPEKMKEAIAASRELRVGNAKS